MVKKSKEMNPVRGATRPGDYELGEVVLSTYGGGASEGLFIGLLAEDPSVLVLAMPGMVREPFVEVRAEWCSPSGRIDRHSAQAYRDAYTSRFPRKLVGAGVRR